MTLGKQEQLKRDTHPEIAARLLPFTATPENPRHYEKEELWKAIGGTKGLRQIRKAAGAIALIARDIAESKPAARTAAEEIFSTALCVRGAALLCIAEAAVVAMAPSVPRILAWTIAHHYVGLSCALEGIESIG